MAFRDGERSGLFAGEQNLPLPQSYSPQAQWNYHDSRGFPMVRGAPSVTLPVVAQQQVLAQQVQRDFRDLRGDGTPKDDGSGGGKRKRRKKKGSSKVLSGAVDQSPGVMVDGVGGIDRIGTGQSAGIQQVMCERTTRSGGTSVMTSGRGDEPLMININLNVTSNGLGVTSGDTGSGLLGEGRTWGWNQMRRQGGAMQNLRPIDSTQGGSAHSAEAKMELMDMLNSEAGGFSRNDLSSSCQPIGTSDNGPQTAILREQLIRNYQFFGGDAMDKICASFVVVIGVGGVGSHAAISLARSGVKKLRIIDFDRVTLSSLNQHAVALRSDVGLAKVECLRRSITAINPQCTVEAHDCLFTLANAKALIKNGTPDFVIDCINNLPTKIDAICYCKTRGIPVVSVCRAGGKDDPTKLRLVDIADAVEDNLALALRQKLNAIGIHWGLAVCYSAQRGGMPLAPLQPHQQNDPTSALPVFPPLPAMMGQILSAYVLRTISGRPLDTKKSTAEADAADKITRSNYKRLFEVLKQHIHIKHTTRALKGMELDYEASQWLFTNVFMGESCLPEIPDTQTIVPVVSDSQPNTDTTELVAVDGAERKLSTKEEGNRQQVQQKDGDGEATAAATPKAKQAKRRPRMKKSGNPSLKQLQLVPWLFVDEPDQIWNFVKMGNMVLASSPQAKVHLISGGTAAANEAYWGSAACAQVATVLEMQNAELCKQSAAGGCGIGSTAGGCGIESTAGGCGMGSDVLSNVECVGAAASSSSAGNCAGTA